MATKRFKDKKILITAGPTWVAIDAVRVISNCASGLTGIILALQLQSLGARVTLLLGPVGSLCHFNKKIRLIRYRYFGELREALIRELKTRRYDAVIHSAAVADYQPLSVSRRKIPSSKKQYRMTLVPTPKLVDLIKRIDPSIFAVGFKFEPNIAGQALVRRGRELLRRARLDLVVANSIDSRGYRACLVSPETVTAPVKSKESMANGLVRMIGEKICRN